MAACTIVSVHPTARNKQNKKNFSSFSLFMMHMYLLQRSGGWCGLGGRQPEPKRYKYNRDNGNVCINDSAIFIAHTEEKLQKHSSPEAGELADLATLRERPGGGSGSIIIILLSFIHCQYLYCSHGLRRIQPTGDNRFLAHKSMIKKQ